MLSTTSLSLSALGLLVSTVAGQVFTDCNPLNVTCPPNPALGTSFEQNFNSTPREGVWNVTNGRITYDEEKGAVFTVAKKGDSPTIETNFYFFFGRTEVVLQVAPGDGIISSIVWLSDILDEVDWEFFGSNDTHAETNYFGRGEPDFTNAIYHPMPGNTNPISDFHNYTTTWTAEQMDFWIDDVLVRTLLPEEAKGGRNYPQTPMKFSLGIWAAGDPDQPEGTREWAQGTTDYSKGPFSMYVKSAVVEDYSTGKEYVYSDNSGDWQSIEIVSGNSTAKEVIEAPPEKTLVEKWNDLPQGGHIGIIAGGAAAVLGLFGGIFFYCWRQRRRGAQEAAAAAKRAELEQMEINRYHQAGVNPDGLPAMAVPPNAMAGGTLDTEYRRPQSPVSSYRGATPMEDKAWDPTAGGNGANPMPLLRDDQLQQNQDDAAMRGGADNGEGNGQAYSDNPNQPPRLTTPGPQGQQYWQGR